MASNPFAQIPVKDRLEMMQEKIENDRKIFDENYLSLKNWFAEYNALYILSFYVFYFLARPEGVDKEASGEPLDFHHSSLEILQAFALMQPVTINLKPLKEDALYIKESLKKITNSYHGKILGDINPSISQADFTKQMTVAEIRSQTAFVRNDSYNSQALATAEKVLSKIANYTEPFYGLNLYSLIEALIIKSQFITDNLNDFLQKLVAFHQKADINSVLKSFTEAFDCGKEHQKLHELFIKMGSDIALFKGWLTAYADLRLQEIFTISPEELAFYYQDESKAPEIAKVLDILSYSFGDLANSNPGYFILDNPVLKKPFIKISDDRYFSSLFGIIFHLLPNIIEVLVKEMGSPAVEKLQKAKANFLEEETKLLFEKYFPNAQVFSSSKWTDPITGKIYENDLLLVIDRYAFVVECKSGAIDPSARRGGEARIVTTLRELVVKAAQQAKKFIKHLADNPGVHVFPTADGRTNRIDNSQVAFYIPLSITLETLGTVSANLKRCLEAGLIEGDIDSFIPTMTVTDLEMVFEILDNEIERIHYLVRRSQIERNLDYIGDEADLLAFYLDTGFNLGTNEEPGKIGINVLMKSKEIDPYFTAMENGVSVPKPRLVQTKWWKDIMNHLIKEKPAYWSEIGYVLMNVSYVEQKEFERKFKNYRVRTKADMLELPFNWIILETKPESRSYLIAGFPYLTSNLDLRNQVIKNQILTPKNVGTGKLGAVCIGQHVNSQHYPYSVLTYVPLYSI